MVDPRLSGNTPELTEAEQERLFGLMPAEQQSELADLFWQCETPSQRKSIYRDLRQWWLEAAQAAGVQL